MLYIFIIVFLLVSILLIFGLKKLLEGRSVSKKETINLSQEEVKQLIQIKERAERRKRKTALSKRSDESKSHHT